MSKSRSRRSGGAKPAAPTATPATSAEASAANPSSTKQGPTPPRRAPNRRRKQQFPLTAVIIGVIVLVVGIGLANSVYRQTLQIDGVQTFGALSREHVTTPVEYPQNPPVGGSHSAAWQNCGIYYDEVNPVNAVHSLEHGAVWISYRSEISEAGLEALRDKVRGQSYLLLSPNDNLPGLIGLSAWGTNLVVSDPNDPRIDQFITKYRNGTQTPEPGAQCIGGVGSPNER